MAYKYENVLVVCQKSKIKDLCNHWKENTNYRVLNFYDLKPKELKEIDLLDHTMLYGEDPYSGIMRNPLI